MEKYVKELKINADAYKFGVVQYAGYMGCGLHKIDKLVGLDYWAGVSNHCSCLRLMPHYLSLPPTTLKGAQKRSDKAAQRIAEDVKTGVRSEKKPPKRIANAVESAGFANINKLVNKKMSVNDACIACGQCVKLCPRENIKIEDGKATLGKNCIGCMSCAEYCPQRRSMSAKSRSGASVFTIRTSAPTSLHRRRFISSSNPRVIRSKAFAMNV